MNEYVESKVGPPGIALAVLGAGTILLSLVLTALGLLQSVLPLLQSDDIVAALIASATTLVFSLISPLLALVGGVVVLLSGLRLRSARSSGLVYLGSIMAMVPCCTSYCCCLGIPLGIWAIMTMQDEQVQAAFAEG